MRAPSLLPALFLLCALPVLLFLALRVPTGESPDEVAHIIRMESLLHRVLIGHRVQRVAGAALESGVTANAALLAAGFTFPPGTPLAERTLTRERVQKLEALQWERKPGFVSIPNTAVYAPVFYVPGAVGMQVAKQFGYGPWEAILAARMANALVYAGLGLAALLLAGRAQGLIFAVLTLPMSLWLGASCNQDGLMIAVAALAVACLTRATLAAWWAGAACVAVMALAKPPYLPLAGVVFVLLPWRGTLVTLRMAGAVLAAGPALAWFALAQRYAVVPFVREPAYTPGPYWPGDPDTLLATIDPALQMQVLLHRPSLLLSLPLEAMWNHGGWLVWEAVGLLGILDILLPAWLYLVWLIGCAALLVGESVVPGRGTQFAPGVIARLAVAALLVSTVLAVFDGQYVSWTRTGWAEIEGVQGRYFIPLLPFAGLVLPIVRAPGGFRSVLRLPVVAAALAGLAIIPGLVVATYYLR